MTFMEFETFAEMQEYLRKNAEAAAAGLHDDQRTIGLGDHWIRFVDIASREIEFGHVYTLDEVRAGEIKAGATKAEAADAVAMTERDLADHRLFGRAYIYWQPEGELGYTHRASVWPTSGALFDAARSVDWQIDRLPQDAKVQIEAIFRTARDHARTQG